MMYFIRDTQHTPTERFQIAHYRDGTCIIGTMAAATQRSTCEIRIPDRATGLALAEVLRRCYAADTADADTRAAALALITLWPPATTTEEI